MGKTIGIKKHTGKVRKCTFFNSQDKKFIKRPLKTLPKSAECFSSWPSCFCSLFIFVSFLRVRCTPKPNTFWSITSIWINSNYFRVVIKTLVIHHEIGGWSIWIQNLCRQHQKGIAGTLLSKANEVKVSKFEKQIFFYTFEPKKGTKLFFDFCPSL